MQTGTHLLWSNKTCFMENPNSLLMSWFHPFSFFMVPQKNAFTLIQTLNVTHITRTLKNIAKTLHTILSIVSMFDTIAPVTSTPESSEPDKLYKCHVYSSVYGTSLLTFWYLFPYLGSRITFMVYINKCVEVSLYE